ncbi:MAG TPA: UDP-glucose/GDP-mannose dehydrogenase family protein [Methanobacterium sp.]
MKITVIGAGYVGLVTAACLAEVGHQVLCAKKSKKKFDMLRKGISPIYEPGLSEMLQENLKEKRIEFTIDIKRAVEFSEVIFICVGTPTTNEGSADLSQVEDVVSSISKYMDGYKLIIEKSTVPVNTHLKIKEMITGSTDISFDVASNPEFLAEGTSVYNFMNPNRIVAGVDSQKAREIFEEIYEPFTSKGYPLLFTDIPSAEIIKYASNAFLAIKISFINMIANLCERTGASIDDVSKGVGLDHRIGDKFLNAGLGYGGSCLPKDVNALIHTYKELDLDIGLLQETEKINQNRREIFYQHVEETLGELEGNTITLWGLAFKPNTDDIRAAPAIDIARKLQDRGANLKLYDPEAEGNFSRLLPESENITYFKDKYEALKDSHALLLITEWDEFKESDIDKIKELMASPNIIDGRNILDKEILVEKGFRYVSMGR